MEYQLNKHGVFVRPEQVEIDKHVMISLAERKNKWYYGYICNFSLSFSIQPCMEILTLGYNTRNEALKSAINRLLYLLEGDLERNKNKDYYKLHNKRMCTCIRNLKDYLYNISYLQLSLFD